MENFQDILIGILLISVMFSVGFDLTWDKMRAVLARPAILATGLVLNYVVVPAMAFGSTRLFGVPEMAALGIILVSATPGGPFGAMLVQKSKTNLAAAVSLLVTMTILNTFMTPIILGICSSMSTDGMSVPIGPVAKLIVLYQMIPLGIAMSVRARSKMWAERGRKSADMITNLAFVVLLVGMVTTQGDTAMAVGWETFAAMQLLIMGMLAVGMFAYPFDFDTRVAFALTNTIRSLGLALLLAASWFDDMTVTVTAMCYGLVTFVNAIPLAAWVRIRKDRKAKAEAARVSADAQLAADSGP